MLCKLFDVCIALGSCGQSFVKETKTEGCREILLAARSKQGIGGSGGSGNQREGDRRYYSDGKGVWEIRA